MSSNKTRKILRSNWNIRSKTLKKPVEESRRHFLTNPLQVTSYSLTIAGILNYFEYLEIISKKQEFTGVTKC